MRGHRAAYALLLLLLLTAACSGQRATSGGGSGQVAVAPSTAGSTSAPAVEPSTSPAAPENRWVTRRPAWLGHRVLPKGEQGFGKVVPTPRILRNRRLATIDLLPPPTTKRFTFTLGPVPQDVVERSTFRPKCPVTLDQLSYVTMSFWGFDHERHTGEMIVNASVAEQIVGVFKQLYQARFPIEEMRVVRRDEVHAPPTGDTNVTSSFECRQVTLGTTWSQHSYGLAVDINPFDNPYWRGDIVAPELASAYLDRTWSRPGMILEGDVVTSAFDAIGWGWGGRWNSLKDWMHFSQNGH